MSHMPSDQRVPRRRLGRTGLQVSHMGLGTGGLDPLGQTSGMSTADAINLIQRAFELGINYFDTAPPYLNSEDILGDALRTLPRDQVVISTKVALAGGMPDKEPHIATAQEVRNSVENSLRRLRLETIDLLLMAVSGPQFLDVVMNEHMPVLDQLRREGKFRFLGSSEQTRSDGSHRWLQVLLPLDLIDVAMVGHNLINQSAQNSVFPVCAEHDLGVINIFTVRRAISSPARLREVISDLNERGMIDSEIDIQSPLQWLVEEGYASSVIEASYRYVLSTGAVSTVLCGTSRIHELEANLASISKGPLPEGARSRLKHLFGRVAEPIGN